MSVRSVHYVLAAALCAASTASFAQPSDPPDVRPQDPKTRSHDLRSSLAQPSAPTQMLPPSPVVATTCNGAVPTVTSFTGTNGPLPDLTTVTFTAIVSGAGTYIWDVDLNTAITHTYAADLEIKLTSPAGTIVVITTDNGGVFNDVWTATLWDDNANDPVNDHAYIDFTLASPLSPEGRLTAFRGENPNGTWTLTSGDDGPADVGNLNSWSLDIATVTSAPGTATTTVSRTPALALPDLSTITDTVSVSGAGTSLSELTLYLEVTHTYAADMDITLTSPSGAVVVVSTDNGVGNDDVWNGTLFHPGSTDTVSDHAYVNLLVAPLLSPEGAFDNFGGQDPNGTWTLTIADDAPADIGMLHRWDLNVTTCASVTPFVPYCSGDGSGTACPCGNAGAPGNGCASSVNSAGANLAGSGVASISNDTFVLTGSGMPSSSALYFQGTMRVAAGAGAGFGDGLRCAGGSVIRLGTKTNVAGTSSYPVGGDLPIHVKGNDVAGNVRDYQCWYRNAAAFCTASTFNLSNGLETTWIP